jgi:hypothetical protein
MKNFLPPPVTPSDEEPIAAGGRQNFETPEQNEIRNVRTDRNREPILPPLMTPSGEEPIGMGGW